MKINLLLAGLFLTGIHFADAENIRLSFEMEGDRVIYYELPREAVTSVPVWDPTGEKDSPLTRDEAVKIAKREAGKVGVMNLDETEIVVSLLNIDGDRVALPKESCRWFYRVDLEQKPKTGKTRFVIIMDGTVAKPVADPKGVR